MSDNDIFAENPFRALDLKNFPDRKKAAAAKKCALQPEKGRGKQRVHAGAAQDNVDDATLNPEETELFMQAMSRVRREGKKGKGGTHGFRLEEQCSLPDAGGRKKVRKENRAATGEAAQRTSVAPERVRGEQAGPMEPEAAGEATQQQATANADDADALAFLRVMGEVRPLQARGREVSPEPQPTTPPPRGELSLQDFMDGKLEFALSFTDEYLEGHVVGLDQMIMNKLRAGGLSPEAHLDLHGLNAVQAFEALRGFMRGCWYKGLRTVLVVPGRGRNSPDGMGVLREKLQSWLTQDPFKRVVLAFCTAQSHDGGPGSVYVLLRKYRKKGRIYWERMPADADLY